MCSANNCAIGAPVNLLRVANGRRPHNWQSCPRVQDMGRAFSWVKYASLGMDAEACPVGSRVGEQILIALSKSENIMQYVTPVFTINRPQVIIGSETHKTIAGNRVNVHSIL